MSSLVADGQQPPEHGRAAWACPTCAAAASGDFCAGWGERRPSPHGLSLRHLAGEIAEQVSSLDTKPVRTAALLFARPGALLVEYRRGAHARYTSPVQLFVWTNVAFFFVAPALDIFNYRYSAAPNFDRLGGGWWADLVRRRVHEAGSLEGFRVAYNAAVGGRMQTLFAVIVPALALVLLVLHPRRRVMEHVVFRSSTTGSSRT